MKKVTKSTVLKWTVDIFMIVLGAAVYSVAVRCFVSPNNIAPGGATGIAIIINSFVDIQVGTLIFLLNIPLIIAGFILLNRATMVKTLISVASITVFTDIAEEFMPVYKADTGNGILAGALMGIGLGITYQREGTTGGTDILTKIIQRFFPDFKLGTISMAINGAVVAVGFVAYKDLNVVLFAIVTIFVETKLMDMLVYGRQEGRFLLIFSENSEQIAKRLLEQNRGVTYLKAQGAYTGNEHYVVATAVHRTAYSKVKRIISEVDPKAFVVTTSASEVLGNGFTRLSTSKSVSFRKK